MQRQNPHPAHAQPRARALDRPGTAIAPQSLRFALKDGTLKTSCPRSVHHKAPTSEVTGKNCFRAENSQYPSHPARKNPSPYSPAEAMPPA